MWTEAIDSLINMDSGVDWTYLFSKLTKEKQNYCIHMLVHKLATPVNREGFIDIIKQIGEAAIPIILETFYNHVNTITTTEDFEKLQDWLEWLLKIIVYCNPPEVVELFIEIYQKSSNQDVQYMILDNLGKLGDGQAIEFILEKLSDEIIYTRVAAIRALGLTKDAEVVSVIANELENNKDNSLYVKSCLEALMNIGDIKSIEIITDYLDRDLEYSLKEKIVEAMLQSPHIKIEDIESWFSPDVSYETQEILVKVIAEKNYRQWISESVIKYVVDLCLQFYSKGNDMYIWGVRFLKVKEQDSLQHLVALYLDEKYKHLEELDILISEFGGNAFPYLKSVYPLVDSYEEKDRIVRLMGLAANSHGLARFIMENIDDMSNILLMHIEEKDEEKILELFEVIGNALKDYDSARAVEPIASLLLSKCLEAGYSDEERFYIKILYHFYKYFYFKELEDYFIDYLQGQLPFWRYAFEALKFHETDRIKNVLYKYEPDVLFDKYDTVLDDDNNVDLVGRVDVENYKKYNDMI